MKKLILSSTISLAMLFGHQAFANQSNLWQQKALNNAPAHLNPSSETYDFDLYQMNTETIKLALSEAGQDADHGTIIQLPYKNGEMMNFVVWETPIMEKNLQEKYSYVKTYTAHAENNHAITAKLDITGVGFRAAIYSPNDVYFINPYSTEEDAGYYMVFDRKTVKNLTETTCESGLLSNSYSLTESIITERISVRSEFRIAITTTGEYAQSVTGQTTVANVMDVIISTLNRVNGVYERELAVTYILIDENEDLIFTNPSSDPYTCNYQNDCLIDESQATISNLVGHAAYDIGHIFNTAGGGIAALYSLCNDNTKAMGVSTTSGPDDYGTILHEIGHQLGANHVFASAAGGCDGNGNPNTNVEPGSGSTIMSYIGACPPDNIPGSRDLYYNAHNLREMSTFVSSPGIVSNCGVHHPVNTGLTFLQEGEEYHVPKNTPFELTANAEAIGPHPTATILYNWEQQDTGNYGATEADGATATEGPLFKSQVPSEENTRVYPKIEHILDDSYTGPGERITTVARDINFKATARTIFQGYGGFITGDDVTTIKVETNSEFRVTQPSNNETWNPGDVKTIKWDRGGSTANPVNTGYVNIYLSLDDGETFGFLIVANAPNTGSYDYTVHDIGTTKGKIKVKGAGNVFFDVGKGKLNITGDPTNNINELNKQAPVTVYPNPTNDFLMIERKDNHHGLINVEVYNILGQRIEHIHFQDKQLKINTSQWATGNYFIKTTDGNGLTHTIKVLKN